ncbi:hypothetical protein SLA2020_183250 [Shorea laevis]
MLHQKAIAAGCAVRMAPTTFPFDPLGTVTLGVPPQYLALQSNIRPACPGYYGDRCTSSFARRRPFIVSDMQKN